MDRRRGPASVSYPGPGMGTVAGRRRKTLGGYPSGQRGLTVNQLADAFGGSNPSPPTDAGRPALIAQMVEHTLGKGGVMGSIPIEGSSTGDDEAPQGAKGD